LKFEISAWAGEVVGGFNDRHVGFEADCQSPAVNIVELVGEKPRVFRIVNLEMQVGWNTAGLACELERRINVRTGLVEWDSDLSQSRSPREIQKLGDTLEDLKFLKCKGA